LLFWTFLQTHSIVPITEASSNDIPALVALVNSAYRGDTSRKGWTTEKDLLDGLRTDEAMLKEYVEDADATILKHNGPSGQVTGVSASKENMVKWTWAC
jgi:hypothetical protein